MVCVTSTSRDNSMTSRLASQAAARSASSCAAGNFAPEEEFRKRVPFTGNFVCPRGVEPADLSTVVSPRIPMRKLVFALFLLQIFVLPAPAAETPKECTLCVGVVGSDGAGVPTLARVRETDLA